VGAGVVGQNVMEEEVGVVVVVVGREVVVEKILFAAVQF
jgi:hypothetical protein